MSKKPTTPAIDTDAKDEEYRNNFLQEIYEAHENYLSYLSNERETELLRKFAELNAKND